MDRQTVSATFPSEAASVAAARRFVRRVLHEWGEEATVDDALLATSELATNAITYAGTAFEVRCLLADGEVRIEVRDHHPIRRIPMPGMYETSGRGLPSIARLATTWGVTYDRTGKGVWFRLPVSGGTGQMDDDAADTGDGARPLPTPAPRPAAGPVSGIGEGASGDPLSLPAAPARDSLTSAVEAVRDVLGADGAAVLLADRDGRLALAAAAGLPSGTPAGDLSVVSLGPDARGGVPWVSTDTSDPLAAALLARSLAAAPLQAQGRLTGVVVAVSAEPERFDDADGKRLGRIAEEMALSMERARIGELERSWRGWLSFVAEASDLLAGTLDQERTMALVAQLVVPRLATWCAVYTADEAGGVSATGGAPGGRPAPSATIRPAYVWHADENRVDALRDLLEHGAPAPPMDTIGSWSGLAAASAAARAAAGPIAEDNVQVFPLIARGRRIGMIVIGRPAPDHFPRGAVELAEELSRRAALAIDNARLFSAQTAMSSALQRSLLPPGIPDIPGLEVEVVYQPAGEGSEVGGDFYDVFRCGGDALGPVGIGGAASRPADGIARGPRWRFAIGDVCGTGPEAAAVTGLARHALRILAAEDMSVPDVLTRLNRLILAEGPRSRLLTLLHGEITPRPRRDGMRIALVSAGHPLPLVLAEDGTVTEVARPQPLLGVFDEAAFEVDTLELRRGQVLLCVTDGVTERRDGSRLLGDEHGLEKLLAECRGLSAGAVAARVRQAVREFGAEPSNDDVAIIVLRAS